MKDGKKPEFIWNCGKKHDMSFNKQRTSDLNRTHFLLVKTIQSVVAHRAGPKKSLAKRRPFKNIDMIRSDRSTTN